MRQRTRSYTKLAAFGLVVTLIGACGRQDAASDTAGAPPPAPVVDLTKDIDAMTEGELWAATTQLNAHWDRDAGASQRRTCASGGAGGCSGRVSGVQDTTPGPGSVHANGTIVAWMENLGAPGSGDDRGAEAKYGIGRDVGAGGNRYYMIAKPIDATRWKWQVNVAKAGSNDPSAKLSEGEFVTCDTTYPNHPTGVKAIFFWCPAQSLTAQSTGGSSTIAPRTYNPLDPGWLSCSAGCCTAGQ